MKIIVISGTPKKEGLCQSIVEAVIDGAKEGGADVEEARVCDIEIGSCRVCKDGWGRCREEHFCVFGSEGFNELSKKVGKADAVAIVTPVYFWEVTESLKSFLDKFRRCNFGESGRLSGKQVLIVASAGGKGTGVVSCFDQLNRFCNHTGAKVFDYIDVNRWNSDYKRQCARAAAKAIAGGRKNSDTV